MNCKNKTTSDEEIKKQIRRIRACSGKTDTPGKCCYCGAKLDACFSIINMNDGTVTRVTEESEYTVDGETRRMLPALMERYKNLGNGQRMTERTGMLIRPYRACDRAIRLMDEVDLEAARARVEREKTTVATMAGETQKKQQWWTK